MEDGQRFTMAKLPLFQALTEHPLFAKVPQSVLVVLGVITAAFLVIFKFFYILSDGLSRHVQSFCYSSN